MQAINLTPHPVVLAVTDDDGRVVDSVTIPPSGQVARAAEVRHQVGEVEIEGRQFPVYAIEYGEPQGLPDPIPDNSILIVSSLALQAIRRYHPELEGRVMVATDPIRDSQGRIVAARGLAV